MADAHAVRTCSKALRTRIREPGAQHKAVLARQNKDMSGFHHEDVFCSTWTLQGCSNLFRTAAPRPWAAGSAHNNQDNAEQGCTSPYQQQQPKKTHFYVRNNFISLHFPNAKSPRAKSKLNKLSAPPVLIVSPAGWGNEGQNSAGPELCSGARECQRIWDQKGEKHRF